MYGDTHEGSTQIKNQNISSAPGGSFVTPKPILPQRSHVLLPPQHVSVPVFERHSDELRQLCPFVSGVFVFITCNTWSWRVSGLSFFVAV